MWHVNSEVENLKALIDNEFTTIRRSIEDLKKKKHYWQYVTSRLFEWRDSLSKRRKLAKEKKQR